MADAKTSIGMVYHLPALPADGETDHIAAGEHFVTVVAAGCQVAGQVAVSLRPGEAAMFTYDFAADEWRMEKEDLTYRVRKTRRRVEAVRARLDGSMPLQQAIKELGEVRQAIDRIFETVGEDGLLPEEISRIGKLQNRFTRLTSVVENHVSITSVAREEGT